MPWELSSVLSHFRSRVVGHSTAESSPVAASNPLPELETLTPSIPQKFPGIPQAQHLPIDRKILHDPSSYLDAEDGNSLPRGLMPSTRRYSVDGSSKGVLRIQHPRPISDRLSEGDDFVAGSPSSNNPPLTQPGFTKDVSNVAAGRWSTFGRSHENQVPNAVDFPSSPHDTQRRISYSPSLHRTSSKKDKGHSTESIQSTFTLSHLTNHSTATHGVASSLPSTKDPQCSPDNRPSSKCPTPTNTTSSRQYPQTPQKSRSYADPVAGHEVSSVMQYTTPVTQQSSFDSPHTFGYPTPLDKPSRFSFTCSSLPPPMPPLDHPELAAARSSCSKSTVAKQPALPALRDRSNTLPGRLSWKGDLLSSLSFTFRRSVRHHSSLPRVQQVSDIPIPEQHQPRPPNRPRRARTVSGRTRHLRRTSADWSSHWATVGVNSPANQAWPAEVSREILRLSLGEGLELSSGGHCPRDLSGSSPKNKGRPRGDSTQHLPDQANVSLSFFPFPHPSSSRAHSPPPLKEPATLPGAPLH
ncbi:hypothetical protein PAXRUDRAFT_131153 [Paxillus rubicundulus Ve08.2h10]|uniref:Uncharacterized protein n=1 Tax=Paxillus rubicundulus Ve08.2h10 TaxID=930991 RepID=A0A0D0DMB5_9AGAM|nr:hypothetical protein PAXRUDRAFT_131153 [Paxillus rubicundulus Ve08.2h10]